MLNQPYLEGALKMRSQLFVALTLWWVFDCYTYFGWTSSTSFIFNIRQVVRNDILVHVSFILVVASARHCPLLRRLLLSVTGQINTQRLRWENRSGFTSVTSLTCQTPPPSPCRCPRPYAGPGRGPGRCCESASAPPACRPALRCAAHTSAQS